MFDPLSSTASVFANASDDAEADWSNEPSREPPPPTPDKGPTPGLYGREPQIYGQPEAGLISPRETVSSNGASFEKNEPYLRVRITALDRNRRDVLIRIDAQTNLRNFSGSTYRNISRSYLEFQQLYESLVHSNPQTIVPALPLAQTSAPTDEEDDRLVKIMLQRWFTRICEDPILLHDEDIRSFIESDFGYMPTPRMQRRRTNSTGFGLTLGRKRVPDEDEELQKARFELTKLEGQFFDTAKAVDKLAGVRKILAQAHAEMGNKLVNVATTESHPPLGNAFRKLGRTWHSISDLDQAQSLSECVILGDSLGYQGMNARSAKETLQMRTAVLEEYQSAVKTAIGKRRNIERLKASSNIRPERVDEALEEMEEANKYEQTLARRAQGISENLHKALNTHNRYANDDITTALIEHARSAIMYERQLLKELEALRADVGNANAKHLPTTLNGTPRPTIVPPLEDYNNRPPASAPPASNGYHHKTATTPGQGQAPSLPPEPQHRPPLLTTQSYNTSDPLGGGRVPAPSGSHQPQLQQLPQPPMTAPAHRTMDHPIPSPLRQSASTSPSATSSPLPQSPVTPGPSSASPSVATTPATALPPPSTGSGLPPLGGRLVESPTTPGMSKSMFVGRPPSTVPSSPSPLAQPVLHSQQPHSPLAHSDPLLGGAATLGRGSPLSQSFAGVPGIPSQPQQYHGGLVDPLGLGAARPMSASVRVQPTRPRLDAREAASKLANMF